MAEAKSGDTVKVHYTGKLEDGTIFDSSVDKEPLEFKIGNGNMIPGFEKAVVGLGLGETVTTNIPYQEAYGEKRTEMVVEVPKEQVPENITPEVGLQLSISQQDGSTIPVVISDVTDNSIILDANHPLAGKNLIFDIELVDIK